jgi:NADP-dependent 3-hydroxy acid dehydrogenase YdfG
MRAYGRTEISMKERDTMEARAAIVTGASSGIGRAIVRRLIAKGHNVVANARGEERLAELEEWSRGQPGRIVLAPGDAAQEPIVNRLLEVCRESFGVAPSIGVVSAGCGLPGTFVTSDATKWAAVIKLNVLGAFLQLRMLANAMKEDAKDQPVMAKARDIVVMGSSIATNVSPMNPVYGATKFAVHGAAEALRRELSSFGIRVTLIQPGIVATNFQAAAGYDKAAFARMTNEIGPLLEDDDIARIVEFVIEQSTHVHLNDIMVRPTRQAYP